MMEVYSWHFYLANNGRDLFSQFSFKRRLNFFKKVTPGGLCT